MGGSSFGQARHRSKNAVPNYPLAGRDVGALLHSRTELGCGPVV